jgi:thiamine kinase-like enzyme
MGYSNINFDPIFKKIPRLNQLGPGSIQIDELPGYTNRNFRLKTEKSDWVLRIPKPETNQFINRQFEAHNSCIAESLELTAENLWRDESGLSLTMTLKYTRPIRLVDLDKESVFDQLVELIQRLHKSTEKFMGRVDLAELLTRYYRLSPGRYQQLGKPVYQVALDKIQTFGGRDDRLQLSHNDLVLENILIDANDRIWIIDWEYASMASPFWDLATICNAFELGADRSRSFLEAYQPGARKYDFELLIDYRYALQVLSIFWMAAFTDTGIDSKIQQLSNNPEFLAEKALCLK